MPSPRSRRRCPPAHRRTAPPGAARLRRARPRSSSTGTPCSAQNTSSRSSRSGSISCSRAGRTSTAVIRRRAPEHLGDRPAVPVVARSRTASASGSHRASRHLLAHRRVDLVDAPRDGVMSQKSTALEMRAPSAVKKYRTVGRCSPASQMSPVSSRTSRRAAWMGASPGSTVPFGSSQCPSGGPPGGSPQRAPRRPAPPPRRRRRSGDAWWASPAACPRDRAPPWNDERPRA